jgi:hypothetical protein
MAHARSHPREQVGTSFGNINKMLSTYVDRPIEPASTLAKFINL